MKDANTNTEKIFEGTIVKIDDDKVLVEYHRLPKPNFNDYRTEIAYFLKIMLYENSKVIAEAENIEKGKSTGRFFAKTNDYANYDIKFAKPLKLKQSCFIEETGDNKCRIVKIC